MFKLPKLPRLMAVGEHSHFGDASPLFWHFAKSLFSDIDVQWSDTGKIFIGILYQCTQIYELYYRGHIPIIWHINCVGRGDKFLYGDTIQLSDTIFFFFGDKFVSNFWQIFTHDFVTVTCLTSRLISGTQIIFCANGAPYLFACFLVVA
jgi:hypothetical protein